MILEKIGYSYNDLTVVPAVISEIKSRNIFPLTFSLKMTS